MRWLRYSLYRTAGLSLLGVLALLQLASALVFGQWVTAAAAGGVIALLIAATAGFLVPVTRRVLQAGWDRTDIVQALESDLDRQREELAFRFGRHAGPTERITRTAAYAGVGLGGRRRCLGVITVRGCLSSMANCETEIDHG